MRLWPQAGEDVAVKRLAVHHHRVGTCETECAMPLTRRERRRRKRRERQQLTRELRRPGRPIEEYDLAVRMNEFVGDPAAQLASLAAFAPRHVMVADDIVS